jgi:hypothetical protein
MFKPGDRVRCIDDDGCGKIHRGDVYTIALIDDGPPIALLHVMNRDGDPIGAYYADRFRLLLRPTPPRQAWSVPAGPAGEMHQRQRLELARGRALYDRGD